MKKQIPVIISIMLFSLQLLHAQNTTAIGDDQFEQALIDLGIDSDSTINGHVLTSDISSVTDLNISNYNITNLAGIRDFDSLTTLNCSNNRLKSIDISNNLKLKELNCASNLLATLNLTSNTALKKLNCQDNLLTGLDVSKNLLLSTLDFTSNRISVIDIAQNDSLVSVKGSNNQLTSLPVSNATLLEELSCSTNQITALNLTNNTFLRSLLAASNQLTGLDLTKNDSLSFIDVSNNQLRQLDVSRNAFLTNLSCVKNQLTTLDLAKNDSLTFLGISNNQLKSIDLSNNKKLETFICASNQLNQLNLDSNLNLQSLDVSLNALSNIDISGNDSLTSIDVSRNQLSSLNLKNGHNSKIESLNATNNPRLHCIQVDDASAIGQNWQKDDIAGFNEVCYALTWVPDDHFEQALIDLGLDDRLDNYVPTANIDTLHALNVSGKGIKLLTGIKDFVALTSLDCSNDSLSNLNVSGLINLASLDCSSNVLVGLNVTNIPAGILTALNASMNPALTCIEVDDPNTVPAGWQKDNTAFYSQHCNTGKTYVPDDNFEQALIDLGYDNGSLDNYVVTDSISHIKTLDISEKNITDLTGIEAFTALNSLNCSLNKLISLNISNLKSLRQLSCFSNYLSALDVSSNDSLRYLICGDNRLTSLDVTKNTALLELVCDANDLTALDVNKNLGLQILNCGSNYITNAGLDISKNISLSRLICPNNKLTVIDISKNPLLTDLDCSGNYLTGLDLSRNTLLLRLNCSINKLPGIDITSNSKLVDVECNSNQVENLDCSGNIFLQNLSADNNELNHLNISSNDSLRSLSAAGNELQALDISKNTRLSYLKCDDNRLPDLNVSVNDSIVYLSLAGNNITSLGTGNLTTLSYLNCDRNKIEALDLSSNTGLIELHCSGNAIQNLDISFNKNIQVLDISKNNINQLMLSQQDSLKTLSCANNQLALLILRNNKVLQSFNGSGNDLQRLNVQNGNNAVLATFNVTNNPELSCIEVDAPNNTGSNWLKDSTASYSMNCHYDETYVPDDNFEAALAVITGEANNNDNYILTSGIDTITSLDISNKNISDLTGIADFLDLQILNAANNNIDSLDLSKNSALINLNLSANMLDTLDLSKNMQLEILDISSNQLTVLKTDSIVTLKSLNAAFNQLKDLNLSKNSALESLDCASNQLKSLSVNNGNNVSLVNFDATQNPDLICIEVDDPNTIPAGWQKDNTASYSKNCHYNETYVPDDAFEQVLIDAGYDYAGVDMLDDYVPTQKLMSAKTLNVRNEGIKDLTGLEAFVNLVSLNLNNNEISTLDISNNVKLEKLYCAGNLLTKLDISKDTLLNLVDCSSNLLDTVELSANILLTELNVKKNPITSIDLQKNMSLKILDCSYTNLTNLALDKNTALEQLTATNNEKLFSVNIQNGNNAQLEKVNLQFNPHLSCILVDNKDAANSNAGWLKDNAAVYKLICDDDDNDGVPDNEDQCLSTPSGDFVDLFGCTIFMLPVDNFSILSTGETCRSSNNGKINITAATLYNYIAKITADGVSKEFNFTNSIEIRDLHAGTYTLCITIKDEPGFSNCYEIIITEPIDLAVVPRISARKKEITLELSGGTNYSIDLNGRSFDTSGTSLTLALQKGINILTVKTDKECQGIYENTIFIPGGIVYYPNPFAERFTILMDKDGSKEVLVNIYGASGNLVLSKWQPVNNRIVYVDASMLPAAFYTVSVKSGIAQYTFKIVKK